MEDRRQPYILRASQGGEIVDGAMRHMDSVAEAAKRTRWHTIVLVITFIMTFVATWNVLPFSWLRSRLELARHERKLYLMPPERRAQVLNADPTGSYEGARRHLIERGMLTPDLRAIPLVQTSRVRLESLPQIATGALPADQSRGVLNGSIPGVVTLESDLNKQDLNHAVERLEGVELQTLKLIDVPGLGIVLDVNDLGLVAGLAFMIVLIMRGMSLANEYFAVRTVFRRAVQANCLRASYDLLATLQVLTVPLRDLEYHHVHGVGRKVWLYRALPMTVTAMPALITLTILVINVLTFDRGLIVSQTSTTVSIILNAISFAGVAVLVWQNIRSELRMVALFDALGTGDEQSVCDLFGLPRQIASADALVPPLATRTPVAVHEETAPTDPAVGHIERRLGASDRRSGHDRRTAQTR